jgi:hypothetical protein
VWGNHTKGEQTCSHYFAKKITRHRLLRIQNTRQPLSDAATRAFRALAEDCSWLSALCPISAVCSDFVTRLPAQMPKIWMGAQPFACVRLIQLPRRWRSFFKAA